VGPALTALLEGESLFNDASAITLFEVFLQLVRRLEAGKPELTFTQTAADLAYRIVLLSVGATFCDGKSVESVRMSRGVATAGAHPHADRRRPRLPHRPTLR